MPDVQLTKVEVPRGTFWGWAVKPPQEVTVETISYDPQGGRDAKDNIVPRLIGKVLKDTTSYRDRGTTAVEIKAGEVVTIEGGVANVKSGLLAADPKRGQIVQLTFTATYETKNGTGKEIEIAVGPVPSASAVSADDV